MNPDIANLDLDELREQCKKSLYFFAKGILGFDWLDPDIHLPLCKSLENTKERRLGFVLPRGWLKTTLCSIAYPMWESIKDPNVRVLLAQNNMTNARAKLRVIKSHFEKNELLRALFPEVLPGPRSTWSGESLCLTRSEDWPESTFECTGVRGQMTSRHYNIIIEDDTVAPDFDELGGEMLAPTHEDIQKAIMWHKLTLPLLTNPKTDRILVVGTRWYEHDLISHIMEEQPIFHWTTRSCLENEDGEPDHNGRVTYPSRFDRETLKEIEDTLGPYFYSTLMLNRPVNTGDMIFKVEWLKEYETLPPAQSLVVYTTVDCATDPQLSTGRPEGVDYSTVMTCGKDISTGYSYVLEYWRARCSPGEHIDAIFDQVERWHPIKVGYEDVAYQRSIDYWIKERMRKTGTHFILEPVKRHGRTRKEDYIMGLQPLFAAGTVLLRPHMKELRNELLTFPRGGHDDLVDTLAMQLPLWKATKVKRAYYTPDDSWHNTIEHAIRNIQERKRRQSEKSIILKPLSCDPCRVTIGPMNVL